ncbi:DUF2161 domain-containing phosphodiesterase [Fredinandcohnia quinoae]|uniref:DUF2161 family putative PD-(D/E)XK-type phosphodiesterase n=1 Tax=Fredinandcohnia quinoae TaxID=2918902 RepID=A0AAW5DYE6_9BACI|nr:DUF2161 family putative PD-(D/E)XK-type phosphodiesterase [Fredinandcohnia sp. SECRCQ15]MCH1624050.1 DUF2161 family putative PD-(D/E)XK-type phosphodiesterase [Fredinandcohnia sp. SECRCQ15]
MGEGKLKEIDLYKPIQTYFLKEGYEVYGEVNDCDIVAIKGDELVVIELKLSLNADLLIQATKRQKLTKLVYIAIPKPKISLRSKRWNDICHLIRRLELGLIIVSFSVNRTKTDILFEPTPFDRNKSMQLNKRKRAMLIKEVNGRSSDYNVGGSSRTKIMTAYKENCIQIASYLKNFGPLSPKTLKEMGTGDKTPSILTKNYYGWFDRIKRGVYVLSDKGIQEIKEFPELMNYYLGRVEMND